VTAEVDRCGGVVDLVCQDVRGRLHNVGKECTC